jgi:hypothetical protein
LAGSTIPAGGTGVVGPDGKNVLHKEVHEARKGLLRAMWQASVAPRFSSKPIDMEDYFTGRGSFGMGSDAGGSESTAPTPTNDFRNALISSSNLTNGERSYLEGLLQSDDLDSIRRASKRLADKELFPPAVDLPEGGVTPPDETDKTNGKFPQRRDSEVQQQLYRWHEQTAVKPSTMLKRMSLSEHRVRKDPPGNNDSGDVNDDEANSVMQNSIMQRDGDASWEESDDETPKPEEPDKAKLGRGKKKRRNPFNDVNSWIDGNQGVEVDTQGNPAIPTPTLNPFKILGTSGDDASCHPHVLSPPLMEGLQGFMPESLMDYHYWLKYSLVRDGPNLIAMLRHCRASIYTILAIETVDGHVFGSFTSQPWRLSSLGFYGNGDSFVWRMRRSRNEPCSSIVEQALMESKMDVFPFTFRNSKIQFCTHDGISIGEGEVTEMTKEGSNFGHAIRLDGTLQFGSTSNCETFGNPCLTHTDLRGKEFEVANIELWSMTPHSTVATAERAELKTLFLEEGRHADNNLNLLEILVGSPVRK